MLPEEQRGLAWLRGGSRRKRILRFLSGQPTAMTPSEMAKKLCLHRNKVSETLSGLKERRLVEVLNADAAYDRKYRITRFGQRLVALLLKNEKIRRS